MNEYQKQALDFCKKYNVTVTITKLKYVTSETIKSQDNISGYSFNRPQYMIAIERSSFANIPFITKFTGSAIDIKKSRECPDNDISVYDVLACIQKSNPGSLDEFLAEYGYNDTVDSLKNGLKIYPKVLAEYEAIAALFPDDEALSALQEIA